MILDEPDEDADKLDDEKVLASVVGYESPKQLSSTVRAMPSSDWPAPGMKDVGLNLDDATLAWFKAHHADWRVEIGLVLQAWVAAKTQTGSDLQSPA